MLTSMKQIMSPVSKQIEVTIIDNAATGRALRTMRTKKCVSLRELARRMEITAPYLCDLERGNRNWNDDLFARYQKALKQS